MTCRYQVPQSQDNGIICNSISIDNGTNTLKSDSKCQDLEVVYHAMILIINLIAIDTHCRVGCSNHTTGNSGGIGIIVSLPCLGTTFNHNLVSLICYFLFSFRLAW